jgi:hypothetical protein
MAFAVGTAGGQKLIEADIHHNAGDTPEQNARHVPRNGPGAASGNQGNGSPGNHGAKRFGKPARE